VAVVAVVAVHGKPHIDKANQNQTMAARAHLMNQMTVNNKKQNPHHLNAL
jgi:hypothetical protein